MASEDQIMEKQKVDFRLAFFTFICCLWIRKEVKMIESFKDEEIWELREESILA